MRRAAVVVCLAWGALAGPLRAQDAPDTVALAAWRGALAARSEAELRADLTSLPRGGDPSERLRLAWVLTIAGARFDSVPLLVRAADQFYEVTVRRPRWVEGWLGLGETKARLDALGAREVRTPHQSAGTGWAWGSALAYLKVLTIDSTNGPAAIALARLTPRLDTGGRRDAAATAIRRAIRADSTDPMLWLLAARAARDAGASTAVLTALDRALAIPGAPAGGLQFERAWELFALGRRDEAEQAYYTGAGESDSLGQALYREDIAYIADSAELRAWDASPAAERPAWLREFWAGRERDSGREPGSRLVEHRRRRTYAAEHFRQIATWARQYDFHSVARAPLRDVDDRGEIYIRHGEPDATTGSIGEGVRPNASWLYYRPEGNLVLHFGAGMLTGWRLITSLTDLTGAPSPEVYFSRMGLDPSYALLGLRLYQDSILVESNAKLRQAGGAGTYAGRGWIFERAIEQERVAQTAMIRRGLSTDSDPLHFEREFEPIVQVFGAGSGTPGVGRVIVAISLPESDHLLPSPLPDGRVAYALRLRVTAADDSGHTTLDGDSLLILRVPRPLARGEHLSVVRGFDLPATGDQRVRVILTDSARAHGAVRIVNGVPIPDLSAERVQLADLIVGSTRSGVAWRGPDGQLVPLHPLNAWARDDAIEINFEVAGLSAGQGYKVRLGIADLGADSTRPPRAAVEFERFAGGGREFVSQSLGLRTIRPGRYLLTATVLVGDRTLRRERRITVVAPR